MSGSHGRSPGRLRVTVAQSGGIAPVLVTIEVDADALAPGDADALRRLVVEARLFEAPAGRSRPPGRRQPDRGGYRITISDDDGTRSAVVDEAAAPAPTRALLDFVRSTPAATKRVAPLGS